MRNWLDAYIEFDKAGRARADLKQIGSTVALYHCHIKNLDYFIPNRYWRRVP